MNLISILDAFQKDHKTSFRITFIISFDKTKSNKSDYFKNSPYSES